MIGLGTVDCQNAAGFHPRGLLIEADFKALRTCAEVEGVMHNRMRREIVQTFRVAETRQVVGAGAIDNGKLTQRAGNQAGIFQRADAHHAVKPLANNIHQPVAAAEFQFNTGILLQKRR